MTMISVLKRPLQQNLKQKLKKEIFDYSKHNQIH
jgi:hypothetical protein